MTLATFALSGTAFDGNTNGFRKELQPSPTSLLIELQAFGAELRM